jgi:hypothetical protein
MAKLTLNSALKQLQGTIDGLIIKHTPHGPVLCRRPDMSRVRWSPAQLAHRRRMQAAAAHYREVMADPGRAARCVARARKLKVPVSSLVMGEYLKAAGAAGSAPGV